MRAAGTRGSRCVRVDSEQRVPAPKDSFRFVIQNRGPCLEEEMRPASRPVHLLFLHKPPADHVVDRRFDERRANRFSLPIALTIVGPGCIRFQICGLLARFGRDLQSYLC
jgi:hypothetical protein